MQQVVINTRDYAIGLSLSREAIELFLTTKGIDYEYSTFLGIDVFTINKCQRFYTQNIERDDPVLVSVVRQLGDKANGREFEFCNLKIVEIPDDVQWEIVADHDESECVAEVHRVWR